MSNQGKINKGEDMAMRQDNNEKTICSGKAAAPSEIHRLLGLTPAEVDRKLAEFGETPAQAVAAFNGALAKAKRSIAAKAIGHIEDGRARKTGAPGRGGSAARSPIFDDAVAAGHASPSSLGESRPATEADIFKGVPTLDGCFHARVSGVSMTDAGIHDGDLLLVNPRCEPKIGDIVLAHIAPHGQVVKYLECDAQGLMLVSAHPDYQPIRVENPEDLTIHGKVVWTCGLRGR